MSVKTSDHVQAGNSVPDTTIVIPVYNEEGLLSTAIVDLLNGLQTVDFTYEIIVSENGSSDATKEIALGLERKHQHVRVLIGEEPNYGKALKRGIMEAQGTYVLCDEIDICDVDFHQRAMDILRSDQADMVVGSKALSEARDKRPLFRRAGTKVINTLLKVLLDFQGTDTHGLKAFHRDRLLGIVKRCIVDKDLFASEFVIRSERACYRILEIPVEIAEKRPPSINLTKRVPNVLKNLARLVVAIRIRG
jgi:glycosyltransferase involved in cell wall biosynthesis